LDTKMTTSTPQPIRVIVVDDHPMVRRGLATILKVFDDVELAGEAATGEAAIYLCNQVLPDVVLMDMVLPDMDGVAATRIIRKNLPKVKILALSSFKDEALVLNVMQAGAIGYLLKDISANDLVQAIRAAHTGQVTFSPEASKVMIHAATQPPTIGNDLTERERVVLALMVEGLNNTQIATRLVVSPSTIKSHVSNILSKLNVSGRTEAVSLAVRNGLIA
jgi:NarL family two-component system response regulator LiaR